VFPVAWAVVFCKTIWLPDRSSDWLCSRLADWSARRRFTHRLPSGFRLEQKASAAECGRCTPREFVADYATESFANAPVCRKSAMVTTVVMRVVIDLIGLIPPRYDSWAGDPSQENFLAILTNDTNMLAARPFCRQSTAASCGSLALQDESGILPLRTMRSSARVRCDFVDAIVPAIWTKLVELCLDPASGSAHRMAAYRSALALHANFGGVCV